MNRVLRTMIALAICATAQMAAAQGDDDQYLDDPEAGFTSDDEDTGDSAEGSEADEEPEAPPDLEEEGEVSLDDGAFITLRHIQAGAALGYAASLESGNFNPFGLAFGLAVGVTLESNIHVGLFFNYHLGDTSEGDIPVVAASFGEPTTSHVEKSWAFHLYGVKVGYEVEVMEHIVGRPLGVLGIQAATVELCEDGDCANALVNDFLFGLGGELLYLGDGFYVGPQLRWNISLGDPAINSLSMLLDGGVSF